MSQYLLRTCKGETDEEISIVEIDVPGETFFERLAEMDFLAYTEVVNLMDEAVTVEVEETGKQTTHFMLTKTSTGRYVYLADGKAVASVHVCLGELDEKPQ